MELEDGKSYKSQVEDMYIRLQADFRISKERINILYQVVGKTETPLLLLDALNRIGKDGIQKYDNLLSFVSFVNPAEIAVKRIFPPLPRLKNVEAAYIPWGHLINNGKTTRSEILIKVPVEEFSPYYVPNTKSVYRAEKANQIKLVLEYVILKDGVIAKPILGTNDLFQFEGAGVISQKIELTIQSSSPISVKRRSDMFEPI